MTTDNAPRGLVRLGPFEVDLDTGELSKQGRKIKLQEQPFQVLSMLLEWPGQLVSREHLRQRLWPGASPSSPPRAWRR